MPIKNTGDLRAMLIETIERVRDGEIDPSQAHSMALLSGIVLSSARLDLEYARSIASGAAKAISAQGVSLIDDSNFVARAKVPTLPPTAAVPGSPEKIEQLRKRAAAGQRTENGGDAKPDLKGARP